MRLSQIKKATIVKKMVRAARGLGYTLVVRFDVDDKRRVDNESSSSGGVPGVDEVMVFVLTPTGGLWGSGIGEVSFDDELLEEEEEDDEGDEEEGVRGNSS
jgi:hypothetical protein